MTWGVAFRVSDWDNQLFSEGVSCRASVGIGNVRNWVEASNHSNLPNSIRVDMIPTSKPYSNHSGPYTRLDRRSTVRV